MKLLLIGLIIILVLIGLIFVFNSYENYVIHKNKDKIINFCNEYINYDVSSLGFTNFNEVKALQLSYLVKNSTKGDIQQSNLFLKCCKTLSLQCEFIKIINPINNSIIEWGVLVNISPTNSRIIDFSLNNKNLIDIFNRTIKDGI